MKKPMRFINNGGVVYYETTPADYDFIAEQKMPVVKFENNDSYWIEADEIIKVLEEAYKKFQKITYLESIKRLRDLQAAATTERITEWEAHFERDVS